MVQKKYLGVDEWVISAQEDDNEGNMIEKDITTRIMLEKGINTSTIAH
jgi:hypothetical protein